MQPAEGEPRRRLGAGRAVARRAEPVQLAPVVQQLEDLSQQIEQLKDETKEMRHSPAFKALDKAAKASAKGGSTSSTELQKQIDQLQQQMANGSASQDAMDKMKRDLENAKEAAAALKNKSGQASKEAEEKL